MGGGDPRPGGQGGGPPRGGLVPLPHLRRAHLLAPLLRRRLRRAAPRGSLSLSILPARASVADLRHRGGAPERPWIGGGLSAFVFVSPSRWRAAISVEVAAAASARVDCIVQGCGAAEHQVRTDACC